MSTFPRASSPTLSVREKSLLKRRINKEHNSNFRAGYVHINEEHLHRTGIRGRKRFVIYGVAIIMTAVVLINILITWTIYAVLRLDRAGVRALELLPGAGLVRFLQPADVGRLTPFTHVLSNRPGVPVTVEGIHSQPITLSVHNTSSISIGADGTVLMASQGLVVIDPQDHREVINTDYAVFEYPAGGDHLRVKRATTRRVTSNMTSDLQLSAPGETLSLRGSEGVSLEADALTVDGQKALQLKTGNIEIEGTVGTYFERMKHFPSADGTEFERSIETFKVCVCIPSGRLFTVPAPHTCEQSNEDNNPCL